MNTSANTNQTHDTTTQTAHTTGFLRRYLAGALLGATVTAAAVGLAATSHADDSVPAPHTATAPAHAVSWSPGIYDFRDRAGRAEYWRRPYCSLHWDGRWHCGRF